MHRDDPIPALKQQLGAELARLLARWNTGNAAYQIGTENARISELRRGKLARFSLETLIRYVTRLKHDVRLHVQARPPVRQRARGS